MSDDEKDVKELDLTSPDVVSKYKTGAEIVNRALTFVISHCKPKAKIVYICEKGDSFIKEQTSNVYTNAKKKVERGVAFPTCISIISTVCHFSPLSSDDLVLEEGDVLKIDMGCHIDGFISVLAHTHVLQNGSFDGRFVNTIASENTTANTAAEVAPRLSRPCKNNNDVSEAIHKRGSRGSSSAMLQSPRPAHGIHVNPKCLEARHYQTENSIQDSNIWHEENPSNLNAYGNKSFKGYNEDASDRHRLYPIPSQNGAHRPFSTTGHEHKSFKFGAEKPSFMPPTAVSRRSISPISSLPDAPFFPSSTATSRRSISPIPSLPDTPSSPRVSEFTSEVETDHPLVCYGGGTASKGVESMTDWGRRPSDDSDSVSRLRREPPPSAYTHNKVTDIDLRGSRALIDAYGNDRGRNEVDDRPPPPPKVAEKSFLLNGMNPHDLAARDWQNTEEEEYNWEEMSPTLADSSRNTWNSSQIAQDLSSISGLKQVGNSDQNSWPRSREHEHPSDVRFMKNLPKSQDGRNKIPDYHLPHDSSWDVQMSLDRFPEHMLKEEGRFSHTSSVGGMPPTLNCNTDSEARHHHNQHSTSLKTVPDGQPVAGLSSMDPWRPNMNVNNKPDLLPSPLAFVNNIHRAAARPVMFPEQNLGNSERASHSDLHLFSGPQPTNMATIGQLNRPAMPFRHPGFHREMCEKASMLPSPFNAPPPPIQIFVTPRPPLLSNHGPLPIAFPPPNISNRPYYFPGGNDGGMLPPLPPLLPNLSIPLPPSQYPTHVAQPSGSAFSGLIGSLVAKGLLSLAPEVSGEDPVGMKFDLDFHKARHEPAVRALYDDIPRQCSTCGLRFRFQEDHSSHMDWHVTKNRMSKNKHKLSRKWFADRSMWLVGSESVRTEVVAGFLLSETSAEAKDEEMAVPADEEQCTCGLCGEPFDDFYSDETDEWMYRGAMYMNRPDGAVAAMDRSTWGPIVHAKCMDSKDSTHEGEKSEEGSKKKRKLI